MPNCNDTRVITPNYMFNITVDYSKRLRRFQKTLPVQKGMIDLSDCGYFADKFGSVIIDNMAEDYSTLTLKFDGEEVKVPLEHCACVKRTYEETDANLIPPPSRAPERNKRLFGDYMKPADLPQETVDIMFVMYRVFEDIYQEAYYYQKQAEIGDVKAQVIIAKMLYNGWGVRKSRKEARQWIDKAKKASGFRRVEVFRDGDDNYWWLEGE